MSHFDHERLDAYRAAIDFLVAAARIAEGFPRGYSSLADQLRRAATSICLNIAEGAGEFSGKEKARFYRIARRSATECAAALDVRRVLDATLTKQATADRDLILGRDLLLRIVPMLVKMAQRAERVGTVDSEPGSGSGSGAGAGAGAGPERC